jgi:hypothetical protein
LDDHTPRNLILATGVFKVDQTVVVADTALGMAQDLN